MITIPQLEYIIAVDIHRHFVKAAKHCFVTQPTLSMQIKKLEGDLDVIIFDRSKQPIEPTDIGVKIIKQARIIISETQKIDELILEEKSELSGTLNIGIIPTIAPYLLPRFVGKFLKCHPNVHLKVQELLTEDIIDKLNNSSLDVGILVTPLNERGIQETPLYYEPMVLYVNKSHSYVGKSIKANALSTKDMWLLKDGHCFRSQVLNICSNEFINSKNNHFEYESGSLETLIKLVDKEGGYTLLPKLAVDLDIIGSNSTIIEFTDEKPQREVSLVHSRLYTKKRLLDTLKQFIADSVPNEMLNHDRKNVIKWRNQ